MERCAGCSNALDPALPGGILRDGVDSYHLACVPAALLATAEEEYRAILRKGVRYFVDKYGITTDENVDLGERFLQLGRAVETERQRRGVASGPDQSG